ncbi:fumarylacetoacetate hydrolase [Pedococcus dokdonensis]|uniref:fumarylacetoacetase n=1 Tax=Pedococcus dokdonensis TaxID=443156 RepID=A0A1H0QUP3_9MICO|nr:fumarylacetoacetase [Pedococcus dokdonensis]SDP20458.1 fumarylacetoacetate hydrolase [Pedococcus dokdonensis]
MPSSTHAASWLDLPADHPFGVAHLPYGVFSTADHGPRVGVRIGDDVLDVSEVARIGRDAVGVGDGPDLTAAWEQPSLNAFLELGHDAWAVARSWLVEVLTDAAHAERTRPHLVPLDDVTMHLPVEVADYVDFYASEHHASNVGRIFRPDSEPLTPNWKHLPIGYHGRSGTVVVSGTDLVRPRGQRKGPTDPAPTFGPSRKLDIEAELGFVVGGSSTLGEPVPVGRAAREHLFGVVLLNDWSARDIQAWEYVPLGPFLGKSFGTSISAWVTPLAALAAARVPLPAQDPEPLPYLRGADDEVFGLDLHLEVVWNGTVVARPEYRDLYWSPAQMLAHLSVNGASIRSGDLFGSGTISGQAKETRGSFLELSWNGTEPVRLDDGSERTFLEDGDTVVLRGWATGTDGGRLELGEVSGTIRPAATA